MNGGTRTVRRLDGSAVLVRGAVYLSPLGMRCRLSVGGDDHAPVATLLYDLQDGSPAPSGGFDGFTLARAIWLLLRRVA